MYTLFADLIFTRHYCGFLIAAGMDAFSLDRYLPLTFPVAWDESFLILHSLGLSGDDSLINPTGKAGGISYSGKSLRNHFCLYVNIFSSLSQLCDLLRCEIESLPCFIRPAANRPIHQRTLRAIFPGIRTNARFGGSQRLWWGAAACLAFFAVCWFAVFVMICINWWSAS